MKKSTLESLLPDWNIYECSNNSFELETWSNAGENVIISLTGSTLKELASDACDAWNYFNADEHAAEIFLAKRGTEEQRRFYACAPNSLSALLDDARQIDHLYEDVYLTLDRAAYRAAKPKRRNA